MSPNQNKSLTLLELLISISILGLLVLGFSNLDTFTRYHVATSDRQAKLQNDASYVLEHMAKEISKAIGNVQDDKPPITITAIRGDPAIKVWIDSNGSGQRDTGDKQIAYRYHITQASAGRCQVWYCPYCRDEQLCESCDPPWSVSNNVLSKKISGFDAVYDADGNCIDIEITACWDPLAASSPDNPCVTLRNRINLPSVSSN